MIQPEQGVMRTPMYSWSVRSTGDNLDLQGALEVGVGRGSLWDLR